MHRLAGLDKPAEKIERCSREWRAKVHVSCGLVVGVKPWTCRDRLCPSCGHRRSAKISERITELFKDVERPRLVTLTVENVDILGKAVYSDLRRSFQRLRKSLTHRNVRGGVYSIESTRNVKAGTWHPHIHALIDSDFIPQAELSELWMTATRGAGYIVDIRAVDEKDRRGAVAEVAKYATTVLTVESSALAELRETIHGSRLLQPFGSMLGAELEDDQDADEPALEDDHKECPCGQPGPWKEHILHFTLAEAARALVALARAREGPPNDGGNGP